MNIKKWVIGAVSLLVLIGSNVATHLGTERAVVSKVVDNLAQLCYNSRGGAVIETNEEGVYVLCTTVRAELRHPPERNLQLEA